MTKLIIQYTGKNVIVFNKGVETYFKPRDSKKDQYKIKEGTTEEGLKNYLESCQIMGIDLNQIKFTEERESTNSTFKKTIGLKKDKVNSDISLSRANDLLNEIRTRKNILDSVNPVPELKNTNQLANSSKIPTQPTSELESVKTITETFQNNTMEPIIVVSTQAATSEQQELVESTVTDIDEVASSATSVIVSPAEPLETPVAAGNNHVDASLFGETMTEASKADDATQKTNPEILQAEDVAAETLSESGGFVTATKEVNKPQSKEKLKVSNEVLSHKSFAIETGLKAAQAKLSVENLNLKAEASTKRKNNAVVVCKQFGQKRVAAQEKLTKAGDKVAAAEKKVSGVYNRLEGAISETASAKTTLEDAEKKLSSLQCDLRAEENYSLENAIQMVTAAAELNLAAQQKVSKLYDFFLPLINLYNYLSGKKMLEPTKILAEKAAKDFQSDEKVKETLNAQEKLKTATDSEALLRTELDTQKTELTSVKSMQEQAQTDLTTAEKQYNESVVAQDEAEKTETRALEEKKKADNEYTSANHMAMEALKKIPETDREEIDEAIQEKLKQHNVITQRSKLHEKKIQYDKEIKLRIVTEFRVATLSIMEEAIDCAKNDDQNDALVSISDELYENENATIDESLDSLIAFVQTASKDSGLYTGPLRRPVQSPIDQLRNDELFLDTVDKIQKLISQNKLNKESISEIKTNFKTTEEYIDFCDDCENDEEVIDDEDNHTQNNLESKTNEMQTAPAINDKEQLGVLIKRDLPVTDESTKTKMISSDHQSKQPIARENWILNKDRQLIPPPPRELTNDKENPVNHAAGVRPPPPPPDNAMRSAMVLQKNDLWRPAPPTTPNPNQSILKNTVYSASNPPASSMPKNERTPGNHQVMIPLSLLDQLKEVGRNNESKSNLTIETSNTIEETRRTVSPLKNVNQALGTVNVVKNDSSIGGFNVSLLNKVQKQPETVKVGESGSTTEYTFDPKTKTVKWNNDTEFPANHPLSKLVSAEWEKNMNDDWDDDWDEGHYVELSKTALEETLKKPPIAKSSAEIKQCVQDLKNTEGPPLNNESNVEHNKG